MDHLPDACCQASYGPFSWVELGPLEWVVLLGMLEHQHMLFWSAWDHPKELKDATLVMGHTEPERLRPVFDLEDDPTEYTERGAKIHVEQDNDVVTICPGESLAILERIGLIEIFALEDTDGQWASVLTDEGGALFYEDER